MPSAPSTSCAHRPIATNRRKGLSSGSMWGVQAQRAPTGGAQVSQPGVTAPCRGSGSGRGPGSGVAQAFDEAQGAVAEAAGPVEGVGVGALRAAGQFDPRRAGGPRAALGFAQQLAAEPAAL